MYGFGCFISQHLEKEFMRFGFSAERRLIGVLQILGAIGLIGGLWFPLLGKASAGGLALMMFVGILVRIKIRDGLLKTTPAVLYFLTNAYLLIFAY